MTQTAHPAIAYGDRETVELHADAARDLARGAGLNITAWRSDPDGTGAFDQLADAPGLVAAVGDCLRTGAALFIPFPVDVPGEQALRLLAAVLHWHGLPLVLGRRPYLWDEVTDEVDFALRRLLDAAHQLDVAAAASACLPDLDDLLTELLGSGDGGAPARAPVDPALGLAERLEAAARSRGTPVPRRPDSAAPWPAQEQQLREYAAWLSRRLPQREVAYVLNALGSRTRTGRAWTQPLISRLLRSRSTT
ncbi:hypothetical protein [Modestobacter sp. SYSU DS0511]